MSATTDFVYTGEYITLGQFLKAVNIAQSGGEAKDLLLSGAVMVNRETETRRGRKLRHNDNVAIGRSTWLLISSALQL